MHWSSSPTQNSESCGAARMPTSSACAGSMSWYSSTSTRSNRACQRRRTAASVCSSGDGVRDEVVEVEHALVREQPLVQGVEPRRRALARVGRRAPAPPPGSIIRESLKLADDVLRRGRVDPHAVRLGRPWRGAPAAATGRRWGRRSARAGGAPPSGSTGRARGSCARRRRRRPRAPAARAISVTASLLNVVQRMRSGGVPRPSSSLTRATRTVVLPLPAGAITCTTPSPARTAADCSGSRRPTVSTAPATPRATSGRRRLTTGGHGRSVGIA